MKKLICLGFVAIFGYINLGLAMPTVSSDADLDAETQYEILADNDGLTSGEENLKEAAEIAANPKNADTNGNNGNANQNSTILPEDDMPAAVPNTFDENNPNDDSDTDELNGEVGTNEMNDED